MRIAMCILFAAVFAAMVAITVVATLQRNLFEAGAELWPDLWFRATLLDAYCGFLTFYVWVAYKETTLRARILWWILIMTLGNIATSVYVLRQLFRLPRDGDIRQLLLRGSST